MLVSFGNGLNHIAITRFATASKLHFPVCSTQLNLGGNMSTPILPSYFGSYEDLVNALLHNPSLGSGRQSIHRLTADDVELNPQPLPPGPPDPLRNAAVRYLATLVGMKQVAGTIGGEQGQQVGAAADTAIQAFLDDFCGTPPRRIPWPWPGPPSWVLPLASELVSAANAESGAFREGLMQVAARVAEMGLQQASAGR
jgi:hypothetical protein